MKQHLAKLVAGQTLSTQETAEAFELVMSGQATPAQIGAMLAMIQQRGPTVDEITGAAKVMRAKVTPVATPAGVRVVDTCGTGGDHTPTFNVSTTAALVAAAAGRPRGMAVAKHGNRTVTRASGSSQGLEALGVKLDVDADTLARCLAETGFCFCFAPAHHPAMKHAMPVRMDLGMRTLFNLLGPLTNPAGATRQVLGVFEPRLTRTLAQVLANLGCERAMVVHGLADDAGVKGFCELSVSGPSQVSEVVDGKVTSRVIDAANHGLQRTKLETLFVKDPAGSAQVMRAVLEGESGAARDIVCLNAAAALVVGDAAADLDEGLSLAREAIDRGAAGTVLKKLIEMTNR